MRSLLSLFFSLLLLAGSAVALEQSPDALVQQVTDDVLNIVRQDKDIQSGDTAKALKLVETKVLPYFDFRRMTALAVGRNWNKATPEQQQRLAEEFKNLLVRTYSNALTSFKDQSVSYRPSTFAAGATDVVVKTEVVQPGSQSIPLNYSLEKQGSGWKVYDVIVSGVSLVTNYRGTFAREVSNKGIDGLIQMLSNRNMQLANANK